MISLIDANLFAAGGPFETRKRRFIYPLIYIEILLWVLLLCFTSEDASKGQPRCPRLQHFRHFKML